jgi:hypothetical protein
MKIGYKGLSKDMVATQGLVKEQYVLGQTYTKVLPEGRDTPALCTAQGYHYCNRLQDVSRYYSTSRGNRFFKIEVLGKFTDGPDKSITTSFRLLEEIPLQDVLDETYIKNLNLDLVAAIQKKYPMLHVGGSAALFLHGVRLKRWGTSSSSDLDFISPYFILLEPKLEVKEDKELDVNLISDKGSGNDFDVTYQIGNTIVDYKIDPKQRYELIEYKGFTYKVSNLMTILEAKMRYAQLPSGGKHKKDITEMVTTRHVKSEDEDLIF